MTGLCKTFRSRFNEPDYRKKFIHTLCIFYTFIVVGICVSQPGPAFLDLQQISNTNIQQASLFFTGGSIGSVVGCLAMGFISARLNKAVIMTTSMLATAVSVTALPWCSPYILMIVMHACVALCRAVLSAGGNTILIRTWETERRVFLHILHFCFAVGGSLGPLITEPFLAPRHDLVMGACNSTAPVTETLVYLETDNLTSTITSSNSTNNAYLVCHEVSQDTNVHFAYLITGAMSLVGFFIFIIQHCCFAHKEKTSDIPVPTTEKGVTNRLPLAKYIVTIAFILMFLFFLIAVETSMSSYLLTFVVKQLSWTKESGAELTSVFWGCYAVWRFATIFYTHFIPPCVLLLVSSSLLLLSTIGILLSSIYENSIGIWMCIGLGGLSLSSQYPAMLMWAEESIIRLTPRIVSLCVMACTFPGIIVPLLIGYLMQQVSPLWLFYVIIIMCGTCLILLLSLYTWTKCVLQPTTQRMNTVNI